MLDCVLIGYGQIGKGVYEVFSPDNRIAIVDLDRYISPRPVNLMLVAIPYTDDFVTIVKDYQQMYEPELTIIFSTVAIGTTSQIPNAVHSPVEGKHPDLAESIRLMARFVGGVNDSNKYLLREFFGGLDVPVVPLAKPEHTEFLKLRSTSLYGLNIEFARYTSEVCEDLEMPWEYVKLFDSAYNLLYAQMGMVQYQRYILNPPEGNIGGHCVVPNSIILDKQYPSVFLKEIYRDKEGCADGNGDADWSYNLLSGSMRRNLH